MGFSVSCYLPIMLRVRFTVSGENTVKCLEPGFSSKPQSCSIFNSYLFLENWS